MTANAWPAQPHSWKRFHAVDVLRGLSILAVVLNHINIRIPLAKTAFGQVVPSDAVNAIVWNGQNGVTIFFAVSGFLITSTAIRRWGSLKEVNPGDFYRLRFARIAPLLLLLLVVLSVLDLMHMRGFVIRPEQGGLVRALFAALTFHLNWLEAQRGYLPGSWDVLWSLSVEEMFYLFFPLFVCVLRGGRWLILFLAIFVALGPFARTLFTHNALWVEKSYLGSMDAIALGCLTAIGLSKLRMPRRLSAMVLAIGVSAITLVLCFSDVLNRFGLYRTGLDMTMLAVGTCMVIAATANQRQARTIMLPFSWFGRHSYEVYLTHMFVVIWLTQLFTALGQPMAWALAWYAATLALTGLLGWITARWYSEPMNRRLRRILGTGAGKLGAVSNSTP